MNSDKTHTRVLPRDLFNDGKLITSVGFLVMDIHDGKLPGLNFEFDGEPFDVYLDPYNSELMIYNIRFRSNRAGRVHIYTTNNSKEALPLQYRIAGDFDRSDYVWVSTGVYNPDFLREVCNEDILPV